MKIAINKLHPFYNHPDIVNITLHFFLKDVRSTLPPALFMLWRMPYLLIALRYNSLVYCVPLSL